MFTQPTDNDTGEALWGLVLAAGDGKRVQDYVRQIAGKQLPKQYVSFIGKRSMLEHTFHRVERLISSARILTIVARHHLAHAEVCRQLASRRPGTIIVQPENKETGPGILLPLMHLYKQAPEAIVAVFPSDHFILEEDRFIEHVRFAARAVKADSKKLVLLAVEASEPETQYGYVVPRQDLNLGCRFGTQRVSSFVEKPDADLAFELVTAGGLWNTMTMVFKLKTLLDLVRRVLPGIYLSFCRIFDAIDTPAEQRTIDEVYRFLEPVNFSKAIMERLAEHFPDQVGVLPVRDVFWSDWGSQERIEQVKRKLQERYDGVAPTGDRLLAASG